VTYVGHPRYQKTVAAVKSHYFWPGLEKEVVEYIAKCMECQKVKAEHSTQQGCYSLYLLLNGNGMW
jgi:hypothetical protein